MRVLVAHLPLNSAIVKSYFTHSHPLLASVLFIFLISFPGDGPKSADVIPKSLDKAMDRSQPAANGAAGISIRNGPIEEMDVDGPQVNGHTATKRKARNSTAKSYKEDSNESEEDAPLVCDLSLSRRCLRMKLTPYRTRRDVFLKARKLTSPLNLMTMHLLSRRRRTQK